MEGGIGHLRCSLHAFTSHRAPRSGLVWPKMYDAHHVWRQTIPLFNLRALLNNLHHRATHPERDFSAPSTRSNIPDQTCRPSEDTQPTTVVNIIRSLQRNTHMFSWYRKKMTRLCGNSHGSIAKTTLEPPIHPSETGKRCDALIDISCDRS